MNDRLRVHRHGAAWRWGYVRAGEPELTSSIAFASAVEARQAATTAYPDVTVVVEGAGPPSRAGSRRRAVVRRATVVAVLLVLAARAVRRRRGAALEEVSPAAPAIADLGTPAESPSLEDLLRAWRRGAARGRARRAGAARRRGPSD